MTKKEIYAAYGIEYKGGKLITPEGKAVSELLVNGNAKLGKGVWTFSTLAGNRVYNVEIDDEAIDIQGTCVCNCAGCYAQTGFYRMNSTIKALAVRTLIARKHIYWMTRAIIAQIHADNVKLCRIHASGDFHSIEYIMAWRQIAMECSNCVFWTYTKNPIAENAFDTITNVNVVKSMIDGFGYNFGHCDYIMQAYESLIAAGKRVHVCRCGIDKNQHCVDCEGCSKNDYVLFIEHSTAYKAESDPMYNTIVNLINSQEVKEHD